MSSEYGIRTRVTGVRGQRPRPLDELAIFERANIQTQAAKVNLFDGDEMRTDGIAGVA